MEKTIIAIFPGVQNPALPARITISWFDLRAPHVSAQHTPLALRCVDSRSMGGMLSELLRLSLPDSSPSSESSPVLPDLGWAYSMGWTEAAVPPGLDRTSLYDFATCRFWTCT